MRWGGMVAVCAGVLALAAPASAAGYGAGAATTNITPPAPGTDDPAAFSSTCPSAVFAGARSFAFNEPYIDANGNGAYDDGEPFCDANGNGRYDQIYTSGASIGSPVPAGAVHDAIEARAFAISDGSKTDVVVSVVAQGLFDNYIDQMISQAKATSAQAGHRAIADMIVSANHNESSPDTLGIYGGPSPSAPGVGSSPAGLRSGIDDYYMTYLIGKVAQVAVEAADGVKPATLWASQFPTPVPVNLSDNWPTTGPGGKNDPRAIDPKTGFLQARDSAGNPIFTVMSLAAHNQEIGHSGKSDLSSDWPGYFERSLDSQLGGTAIFLVGDNGSEEDPVTNDGSYTGAQATGDAFARAMAAQAPLAQQLRPGSLRYARTDLCVALENNLFKAAAAAGLFGQRQGYVQVNGQCVPSAPPPTPVGPTAPGAPDHLVTNVNLLDVGPDLQLIANPGESFPGLMLGSPWTFDDVPSECQSRTNPGVPAWRSHALYRLQVGLANDMLGYEIPAWAFISAPGSFATSDPQCATPDANGSADSKGHKHKLETEGAGPSASNDVANGLTQLVGADSADPSAHVQPGRYVLATGAYSQFPVGAVGILIPPAGGTALSPQGGTLVGSPTTAGFGTRAVDVTGLFMDYDGQPQAAPDVTTRGMIVLDSQGCPTARYYLDEFPALDTSHPLGAAASQGAVLPTGSCPAGGLGNIPGLQTGAALRAGLPVPPGTPGAHGAGPCTDHRAPRSSIRDRRRLRIRHGRLALRGTASDRGCAGRRGRVARETLTIGIRRGRGRCRFVGPNGRLGRTTSCRHGVQLLARGASRWSARLRLHVPHGRYVVLARAVDSAGNVERAGRRGTNVAKLNR